MNVALAVAGLLCIGVGLGHATIGLAWVLPQLTEERLPGTPFGPPRMTRGMVRVTWHVVTVFCFGVGTALLTLAWAGAGDARTVFLRSVASMFLATTVIAFVVTRPRPRQLLRLPVWPVWLTIAALCLAAST